MDIIIREVRSDDLDGNIISTEKESDQKKEP